MKSKKTKLKPVAKRFDDGKAPLDLIDPEFLLELGRLVGYGGQKYGNPDNWRRGMPRAYSVASALRHINAIQRGEITDKESGRSHAVMAAWNCMVLFHCQRVGLDLPDKRWKEKL